MIIPQTILILLLIFSALSTLVSIVWTGLILIIGIKMSPESWQNLMGGVARCATSTLTLLIFYLFFFLVSLGGSWCMDCTTETIQERAQDLLQLQHYMLIFIYISFATIWMRSIFTLTLEVDRWSAISFSCILLGVCSLFFVSLLGCSLLIVAILIEICAFASSLEL